MKRTPEQILADKKLVRQYKVHLVEHKDTLKPRGLCGQVVTWFMFTNDIDLTRLQHNEFLCKTCKILYNSNQPNPSLRLP